LFGTAALAAVGFAITSVAVARGKTSAWDRRAKRRVHGARVVGGSALHVAALSATPLGKWWGHIPPSLITANRLYHRGRATAAVTVAATSVAAALLPKLLDRLLPHRFPPFERHEPSKHSYPSGHALQTSALALANGYVLRREGIGPAWAIGPLSLGSIVAGLGRLLLDRHWTSDVIGGYFAGIALGATSAGCYELAVRNNG
jgi:undecaprenyl-diphosphatase